ncbi:hypothetical protein [uncultured Amnibacterium sp.]|uniref:hypothetical protein n=1 Tax=uncultured Amnibacterium sp. TaxID=1631851 RepID=UPI0035C9C6CB
MSIDIRSTREVTAPVESPTGLRFARSAALITLFLLASRQFLGEGVTLGHVAALLTAPLWLPALKRTVGCVWIGIGCAVAAIASVWLTIAASADHAWTMNSLVADTVLIAGAGVAIGVLVWAREVLPLWLVGLVYGIGMLVAALTRSDPFGVNAWKFALAIPVAIIALSLAHRSGRRWVDIAVLVALGAVSAGLDSRSYFGEFVIAALLVAWQLLPARRRRRGAAARVIGLFGVVAVAVYYAGTALLVSGLLGAHTAERSIDQIRRAGSIIAGGRPEMGGTAALFLSRPFGFGGGTQANNADVQTAKAGMARLHYDSTNDSYVEHFLFGRSKIELHSSVGDLWAYAGFAGIAFGVILVVLLLVVVGHGIAGRTASGVVLFLVVDSLWNCFFNPLYGSTPILVLALGLGLAHRSRSAAANDSVVIPSG